MDPNTDDLWDMSYILALTGLVVIGGILFAAGFAVGRWSS